MSLLLADITMPDMDGFTLVEQLREDPHWRHLPVILLTSDHDPERSRAVRAVDRWRLTVTKPIKQSDLLDAITRADRAPIDRRCTTTVRPSVPLETSTLPRLRILLAEDSLHEPEAGARAASGKTMMSRVVADGQTSGGASGGAISTWC